MRRENGRKPNYNRAQGRTTRLYSKKTAEKIKRIQIDNYEDREYSEKYDDYWDDFSKSRKKPSTAAIVAVVSLMVVVFAFVIIGLTLLRPKDEHIDLVQADTTTENQNTTQAVIEESDPPVIYGVMPLVVYQGHSVAYKASVYVTDDTDPSPVLEIENDEVDLSTPGTYMIAYAARDKDGNVTREYTTLTVLEGENVVSEEEIYAFADSVLEALNLTDLSDTQKCLKVYEYLHAIGYVDEVHSEDWMQNAYWFMKKREGDCFCYYSAARLLLTRLGYDVMEVRNNNNYVHYWCLVSIDEGNTWWHFDACCWSWGEDGILCLVSDSYLTAFTKRHMTSDGRLIHAWDRTNYPATPAEDFWTDDDRAVIYDNGLIELAPEYDANDDIWNYSNGWDDYYNRFDGNYGYYYYDGANAEGYYTDGTFDNGTADQGYSDDYYNGLETADTSNDTNDDGWYVYPTEEAEYDYSGGDDSLVENGGEYSPETDAWADTEEWIVSEDEEYFE